MVEAGLLGEFISNVGRRGFEATYFNLTRQFLGVTSCAALLLSENGNARPIVLEGSGSGQRAFIKALGCNYVQNKERRDAWTRRLQDVSGIHVRLITSDGIQDAEHWQRYYEKANISAAIEVLGSCRRQRFNLSFYRSAEHPNFSAEDTEKAYSLARILLPALHRHVELTPDAPDTQGVPGLPTAAARAGILRHLSAVLREEGHGLSPREAEVCASIVLGYRTLAISINLGISESTICTHRKRAYAKLRISSQNELFSRYFSTVSRLNGGLVNGVTDAVEASEACFSS